MNASARQRSLPVACQTTMQAAAPMLPRIGPARPTRASAVAFLPSDFALITAPRNGMNIGALALIPSRRSAITCPISWISSSTVNPAANAHPNTKLYAAIETSIVPAVVSSFSLGSSRITVFSFVRERDDRREHAGEAALGAAAAWGAHSGTLSVGAGTGAGHHALLDSISIDSDTGRLRFRRLRRFFGSGAAGRARRVAGFEIR